MTDDWIGRARALYEQSVFDGRAEALEQADTLLDAVDAALCLARGRVAHARFLDSGVEVPGELELFIRAAELFRATGNEAGAAEALFWVGCFHQVVRNDGESALPALRRSAELARGSGDDLTLSYALRHLAFAAVAGGNIADAVRLLEESTQLRRRVGFDAGVAANLVALAQLAAEQGRRPDAVRFLDEAEAIAASSGAAGVRRWIEQARAEVTAPG